MPRFQFRLQSLLTYRESRRDLVRQYLAQMLAKDHELETERQAILDQRTALLIEMQALQQAQQLNVDHAASRRFHAGQLSLEAELIAQQRQRLGEQIAQCRQALTKADQNVKVLEQLSEKQLAEFLVQDEQRQAKQREDAWQAGKLAQAAWKRPGSFDEFSLDEGNQPAVTCDDQPRAQRIPREGNRS
ncbi:MAG TPA: hypothetical protein VFG20_09130 [Planctomycetaceae bacterium]|nr:hypothetical protein [Planctomycetaceae bacterium]